MAGTVANAARVVTARFPYDHTFIRVAFEPARVDSYRRLGFENAACAVAAFEDQSAVGD